MVNSRIEKNKKQRYDIKKEEHIKNTKNITKILIKIFLVIISIFGVIYISCRYIGNIGLVVNEYSLEYDNLPDSFYGLKIVQISDINYNSATVDMKKVEKLVDKVNDLKPDLIIFTGDLVYGDVSQDDLNILEDNLTKMNASLGKYSIFGEDNNSIKIIVKNAGFIDLENTYDLIYKDDYTPILITGIGGNLIDLDSSFSYFSEEGINNNIFTISIMHKADIIDEVLERYDVDLAMGGHSLNGLIKIPGVGGIFTNSGNRKYFDSYYKINDTDLFISSGIGVRQYPYRLFNHPSINLYRLK